MICSCNHDDNKISKETNPKETNNSVSILPNKSLQQELIEKSGQNIKTRFNTPIGFSRTPTLPKSFGEFFRNLPLKPDGSQVKYYDGNTNTSSDVYDAVIDLPIGQKDLHQCADAIIRLRADYLKDIGRDDDISFKFTNGFDAEYSKWKQGFRVKVNGNKTVWEKRTTPSTDDKSYWSYLEQIFTYAGTASLSKELVSIPILEMEIGDVFIMGGFPGHAVIVVDMAIDEDGNKLYLLAQSYMPAQEIQILKNLNNADISPWYKLDSGEEIITPEWNFQANQLKRF